MKIFVALFSSLLMTFVGSSIQVHLTNYGKLYELGMDAYKQEKWSKCAEFFQKAIDDYHFYKNTVIDCRLKCKEDQPEHTFVSFLSTLHVILESSNCLRRCKKKKLGERAEEEIEFSVDKKFEGRTPYNYMQFCYFKDGKLTKAAAAAYTYYITHQDDARILENLQYYRTLQEIQTEDFVDLERKPYQKRYIKGLTAYNEGQWNEAAALFEESLGLYFREEERCRAACEKGFVHNGLPDFINAIADHYVSVLVCQQKCLTKLSMFGMEELENFVQEHYNYLQYAYYEANNLEKAFESIASYLLFRPNDEEMLANKNYYIKTLRHKEKEFVPSEDAVRYVELWKQIDKSIGFVRDKYTLPTDQIDDEEGEETGSNSKDVVDTSEVEGSLNRSQNVKKFEKLGLQLLQESKQLKGKNRFVADGFIREDQCEALADLARSKEFDHSGNRQITVSEVTELVKMDDGYEISMRLLLRAADVMKAFTAAYFSQTGLVVHEVKVNCWSAGAKLDDALPSGCILQENGECKSGQDVTGDYITMTRKKSHLNLNILRKRKKVQRKKCRIPTFWIDTMQEIVGVKYNKSNTPYSVKKPALKMFSPAKSLNSQRKDTRGIKRVVSRSPSVKADVTSSVTTPSKSPRQKKAKKCLNNILLNTLDQDLELLSEHDSTEDEQSEIHKEMSQLLPKVLDNLAEEGLDEMLLEFFRQVAFKRFPLSNIAFLLWTEVVKFHSCDSTSSMRYSEDTKKFWKLGYRTFGGRFIHFMSGYKNSEQIVSGKAKKGLCTPSEADINFAVPSLDIIRKFNPYGMLDEDDISGKPGIFLDAIKTLSEAIEGKSCCVTFDGKKLKQGLTKSDGDVDILGFEKDSSLSERKDALHKLLHPVKELCEELSQTDESTDIDELESFKKDNIKQQLMCSLKDISKHILEIKDVRKKKEYAKAKLIERSGETNWKNGKYVHAICAMIAFIHDIDIFLEQGYSLLDEILNCICYIHGTKIIAGTELNLNNCVSYRSISNTEDIVYDGVVKSRLVKQRTQPWFDARKKAKITGSTIYKAIGLDGLHSQKEHFDSVVCGIPEKEKSDETKQAMQYGTDNELNATATAVGKVLPLLFPNSTFYEEGYVEIGAFSNQPFMVISPDGSIRTDHNVTIAAVELKCPLINIQKQMPPRYLLQCLSETEALDVTELIYLCWRPDYSTVFRVKRNVDLFSRSYKLAERLYGVETPKRTTKLLEETKQLKEEIENECKDGNTVEFITIVSSLKHEPDQNNQYIDELFRLSRTCLMLDRVLKIHEQYYELKRQPASEAVVFLCCDLDREWKDDNVRCAPVCWFPKGYSLDTETMRKLLENVLDVCKTHGLHIPALSFDGQWHNICVRNLENEPLTLYQLQKDVWRNVESMSKATILKEIKAMNTDPKWHFEWTNEGTDNGKDIGDKKRVIMTNHGQRLLPMISPRVKEQRLIEQRKKEKATNATLQTLTSITEDETQVPCVSDVHMLSVYEECTVLTDYNTIDSTISGGDLEHAIESSNQNNSTVNDQIELNKNCILSGRRNVIDSSEHASSENSVQRNQSDMQKEPNENNIKLNLDQGLQLNENEASSLLIMLQTDKKSNNKAQWSEKRPTDILEILTSSDKLKSLRDLDLRIVVRYMNKTKLKVKIKESEPKQMKLVKLNKLLGLQSDTNLIVQKRAKKPQQVKKLSDLSFLQLSKHLKKSDLNIIYAEYLWPKEMESWGKKCHIGIDFPTEMMNETKENSNECGETSITGDIKTIRDICENEEQVSNDSNQENKELVNENASDFWFYSPSFSESRNQIEVSCVDSTHLMTRTRRKCCKGGIEGLSNNPWRRVAKSGKTSLCLAMIDGVIEPMSISVALTHFTESVEKEMRCNGDIQSAELCKDIRKWWQAEDNPGIPAKERISLRMALRTRLLSYVNFSHFPPPSMYVNGWPCQLWEAIIANIDAKIHLYGLCQKNKYNVRAFSSMMGETFFSELTLYDRRGQGTVTVAEFGQFINTSLEKLHMRLDPNRKFSYRTSRKTVYKLVDRADDEEDAQDSETVILTPHASQFNATDHLFDKKERLRVKGKKKEETISSDRNAVKRGSLGVRWENAHRNESKLLPTMRLGLDT